MLLKCLCGNVTVKAPTASVIVRCSDCGQAAKPIERPTVRLEVFITGSMLGRLDAARGKIPRATFVRDVLQNALAKEKQ